MKQNKHTQTKNSRKRWRWLIASVSLPVTVVWGMQGQAINDSQSIDSERRFALSPATSVPNLTDFGGLHSFPQGTWVVEDSPWNFQCQTVSVYQLSRMMQSSPGGVDSIHGSNQPEHKVVLDLFPATTATTRLDGGLAWRSVDLGTVRACVCYRPEASSIIHATVAHRMQANQWQVIRLTPNIHHGNKAIHLLPMPTACRTHCQRFSNHGHLQGEIIDTVQPLDELLYFWSESGWSVEADQADSQPTNSGWICRQGPVAIRVQPTSNRENQCNGLILTALHELIRN